MGKFNFSFIFCCLVILIGLGVNTILLLIFSCPFDRSCFSLLIFISSQAPRGPTRNTHPARLLHASVQEEAAAKLLQHSPKETAKRQGGVGQGTGLHFWGLATPPPSPAGAHARFGEVFILRPSPLLGHPGATPAVLVRFFSGSKCL